MTTSGRLAKSQKHNLIIYQFHSTQIHRGKIKSTKVIYSKLKSKNHNKNSSEKHNEILSPNTSSLKPKNTIYSTKNLRPILDLQHKYTIIISKT